MAIGKTVQWVLGLAAAQFLHIMDPEPQEAAQPEVNLTVGRLYTEFLGRPVDHGPHEESGIGTMDESRVVEVRVATASQEVRVGEPKKE
jgi:hypothetical protein